MIPVHATNSGLVGDCVALLQSQDTLEGTTGSLNWSGSVAMTSWDGIGTGGAPSRVTTLDLQNEDLDGSIPSQSGDLSELTVLLLNDNSLSGSIPTELGDLSDLTHLGLNSNSLSGIILSNLTNLDDLSYLYLQNNQLACGQSAAIVTWLNSPTNSNYDSYIAQACP